MDGRNISRTPCIILSIIFICFFLLLLLLLLLLLSLLLSLLYPQRTVKPEVDVCGQEEHKECIESYIGVVDPSPKEVPFVMNEGSDQWMLQEVLMTM